MNSANVGLLDGWIRMILGLAIVLIGVVLGSWWGALGLVPIATAVAGRCPIYMALGMAAGRRSEKREASSN